MNKHIEILLLGNDCVIVPDFGGFMAHHIDARKDESDGSFLPPIRSIGFNPKLTLNDSLLAQSYVEAYNISYPDAVMRIEDEVRELKQRIESEGKYEFAGIGTISLNEDGNYEFTPCEAGIVSPELYGLGSFKMQSVAELKAKATEEATEAPAPVQDEGHVAQAETVSITENPSGEDNHNARIVALWRNIAVACIAAIIFLLIPAPLTNSVHMAGNHINTKLLDVVMPKDITTGREAVYDAVMKANDSKNSEIHAAKIKEEGDHNLNKPKQSKEDEVSKPYAIVLASHVTYRNASAYVADLQSRGYADARVYSAKGSTKVIFGHYSSRKEASEELNHLNDRDEFSQAWITIAK